MWTSEPVFNATRSVLAVVARQNGVMFVKFNDKKGPEFPFIDPATLAVDRDGQHVAYAAQMPNERWAVVYDNDVIANGYTRVSKVLLGDRVLHCAAERHEQHLFCRYDKYWRTVNEVIWDEIRDVQYNVRGDVAYRARNGDKWFAVHSHLGIGPEFVGIGNIWLSPSADRLVYDAHDRNGQMLVVDHKPQGPAQRVLDVVFSPRGRIACVVANDHAKWINIDTGIAVMLDRDADVVSLLWSPNEQQWAAVIRRNNTKQWFVMIDGVYKISGSDMLDIKYSEDGKLSVFFIRQRVIGDSCDGK